jgi:hypothetical protein
VMGWSAQIFSRSIPNWITGRRWKSRSRRPHREEMGLAGPWVRRRSSSRSQNTNGLFSCSCRNFRESQGHLLYLVIMSRLRRGSSIRIGVRIHPYQQELEMPLWIKRESAGPCGAVMRTVGIYLARLQQKYPYSYPRGSANEHSTNVSVCHLVILGTMTFRSGVLIRGD